MNSNDGTSANGPAIQIRAQYIKELSFSNPNAQESLLVNGGTPETRIDISLSHKQLDEEVYESGIKIHVQARNKETEKIAFILEVQYAAAVALKNFTLETLNPILMIEVPKIIFPFIRELVANTIAKGGYPPLYLNPVNFEQIYLNEINKSRKEDLN